MEILLLIIIVMLGIILFMVLKNKPKVDNNLKTDLIELTRKLDDLKQGVNDSNLKMSERLENNNHQMQNTMSRQLSESNKIVADVSSRLAKMTETNKQVVGIADELKTLQNVLQNPKQRGVFGEYYLETVLDNVLPPKHFQMQYGFKDGQIVDAVVFLDQNKILPIDSKFSLENYNRMVNAKDKAEKLSLLNLVKKDLKARIDETSKYIRPTENTMDFAFMFIPSESLYYDLLISNVGGVGSSRDLIEYAFRDKRVIIVSPTSFMAYLQTVLQGLRSLQIEEQAKEIQIRVGKLGAHITKFDDLMTRMGKSLSTTVGHYNNSYKELAKVDKDVLKISDKEGDALSPDLIDKPNME